jgi:hypothetical protein
MSVSLSNETINKILQEKQKITVNKNIINNLIEEENKKVCDIIYLDLLNNLTKNNISATSVINMPKLEYNNYIYLKSCINNDLFKKIEKDININYFIPTTLPFMKNQNVEISYDFNKHDLIIIKPINKV